MTDEERQTALHKVFDAVSKEDIAIVRQIADEYHANGEYEKRRALHWVADCAEKYIETSEWKNAEVHILAER